MYIGDKYHRNLQSFAKIVWLLPLLISLLISYAQHESNNHSISSRIDTRTNLTRIGEVRLSDTNDWIVVQVPDKLKAKVRKPEWVGDWELTEYAGPRSMYEAAPMFTDHENDTVKVAAWLFSMTSGKWYSGANDIDKGEDRDALFEEMMLFYKTGELFEDRQSRESGVPPNYENSVTSLELLTKRGRLFQFLKDKVRWTRSTRHQAKWYAISALLSAFPLDSDAWLGLKRSAVCVETGNKEQACVSWRGGWQTIQVAAMRQLIILARNSFGEDQDLSVRCDKCGNTKWWSKRNLRRVKRGERKVDMCLSNRPLGC